MSISNLYVACLSADLSTVQELLSTLTLDEINQIEPNGSTSLHAACSLNHSQIVKLLLDSGALRTTKNREGRTAFEEATSEQVKELFSRTFADAQARFSTEISEQEIEWTCNMYGVYGWYFKKSTGNIDIDRAINEIVDDKRFHDICTTHLIEYLFKKAQRTQDPGWLAQIYSAVTGFCQTINKLIALAPLAPLYLGRSPVPESFSSFLGVFRCHEVLKQYRYIGKCYRGMKLSVQDFEENYEVGKKLLVKPFMSTSKSRDIAERFATAPPISSRPLSVLCIYTIPDRTLSYDDNVAIDISSISQYPHEEEVLILPYTSLQIQRINHLPSGLIEIEMGWYSYLERRAIT